MRNILSFVILMTSCSIALADYNPNCVISIGIDNPRSEVVQAVLDKGYFVRQNPGQFEGEYYLAVNWNGSGETSGLAHSSCYASVSLEYVKNGGAINIFSVNDTSHRFGLQGIGGGGLDCLTPILNSIDKMPSCPNK